MLLYENRTRFEEDLVAHGIIFLKIYFSVIKA